VPEDLVLMFKGQYLKDPDNTGETKIALDILKDCGYNNGLVQLLVTNKESGIIGDKKDLERRRKHFGVNSIAIPTITPFHEILAKTFEDDMVAWLIAAATLYLGFSVLARSSTAYMESLTIYMGVFFASIVTAVCDWIKEKQFLKIKDEINNEFVLVYRGATGNVQSVPLRDLVVGDLI